MKKILMIIAIACAAAFANAASVGWSAATGSADFGNKTYYFFVIGQNNVESISAITGLLDDGQDVSSYAFGSGKTLASNGAINTTAGASGKTLGAGQYTAFFALFDSEAPVAGKSKYVIISGQTNMTKDITASAATTTFAAANVSGIVGNASNWQSFGSAGPIAPEPTSGLLLLLGMAGLALKRKHA